MKGSLLTIPISLRLRLFVVLSFTLSKSRFSPSSSRTVSSFGAGPSSVSAAAGIQKTAVREASRIPVSHVFSVFSWLVPPLFYSNYHGRRRQSIYEKCTSASLPARLSPGSARWTLAFLHFQYLFIRYPIPTCVWISGSLFPISPSFLRRVAMCTLRDTMSVSTLPPQISRMIAE